MRTLPPDRWASASRAGSSAGGGMSNCDSAEIRSAFSSGSSRTIWQRERMVGSRPPGACEIRMKTVRDGGSSRFLSSALAALWFMSSAGSTMTTRYPPSCDVMR